MGYFSNNEKMYVPLSIDKIEADDKSYFLSNSKMVFAFLALLPIVVPLYILANAEAGFIPIIIVVVVYGAMYSVFIRLGILEEKRLREMVKELDDNKVSGVEHFWGIDKIGGGKEDDGTIYYSFKGSKHGTTRGLVVMMDRGSTIGVPEGHFENYRKTKEEFLRRLHLSGLDVEWYDIQKEPELQPTLIHYADLLSNLTNEHQKKLLKLQLNINTVYTMSDQQRYVDYVVVRRERYSQDFRRVMESIVEDTLGQNSYFVNPHVASRTEVEDFFKNYLKMDVIDSENIRKSVDIKPFEDFALVHRIVDAEGREVAIQLMDKMDIDGIKSKRGNLEEITKRRKRLEDNAENKAKNNYDVGMNKLNQRRNSNKITHDEYEEEKERLGRIYEQERYYVPKEKVDPKIKEEKIKKDKKEKDLEEKESKKVKPRKHEYEDKGESKYDDSSVTLETLMRNQKRRETETEKEDIKEEEND